MSYTSGDEPLFNGSNWQDLNRVVALAKFAFMQSDDFDDDHPRKCAYVAKRFEGPALDWVASAHTLNNNIFNNFDAFITLTRESFGIAENNITALLRRDLDTLSWTNDVPVFFAEFDRLTLGLGIVSHETRVTLVEQKLPLAMKQLLAQQALSFSNYDTMRERFNCMWALNPGRQGTTFAAPTTTTSRKPRCGNCGKRGHKSPECRGKGK